MPGASRHTRTPRWPRRAFAWLGPPCRVGSGQQDQVLAPRAPSLKETHRCQSRTTTGTKARRKRGEGQWALGYREPLNKNEENKKNDDGLNVRQRIIDVYSKYGFDSIDPADLRGRFRWYGLYTQRRPGIDGGKTAVLEPEELDDRYFMLRIRIDGGQLSNDQLRVDRLHLAPVRARHRGRDRPAEHPAALGGDRERP